MKSPEILMNSTNNTILLVEDDLDLQLLITRAINQVSETFSVQSVADGVEAICYLTGQAPYTDRGQYPLPLLIVTDLQMPRINGLELLTWLKQQNALNHLPVIMMSAADNPDFVNQAIDLGAKSYVLKTAVDNLALNIVKAVTE